MTEKMSYEKIIDEQGEINHEYNNQLMILKGYVNNKKKLNNYLLLILISYFLIHLFLGSFFHFLFPHFQL